MLMRQITEVLRLIGNMIQVTFHLAFGVWKISKLPRPIVTVFGGSKVPLDSPYAKKAKELAQRLVDEKISVITGGGPGIMQAAQCVASNNDTVNRTMGIGVKGLDEELISGCGDYVAMDFFYTRKWLLTHYSLAFAVFPGGYGTLDELAEVTTLIQTKQMESVPIILIGVDYWRPLMQWVQESALKNNLLKEQDVGLVHVTDSIDEAFQMIKKRCEECPQD